jgi:hypothetical protein
VDKKTTSIKIEPKTWKEAKKNCIDKETTLTDYIGKLIKKDLKIK